MLCQDQRACVVRSYSNYCPTPLVHLYVDPFSNLRVSNLTATARQKKLAASGMHLLVPERSENTTAPLSEVVAQSGTKVNTK